MRYIATLALILAAGVSSAAPKARYVCTIANDHANLRYRSGENAVFNVTVADTNGVKASSGEVTAVLDNFGYEKFASLKFDLAKNNPFVVTGRLAEAGFLRLTVSGKDVSTRVSSVAYEPELIRAGTDRPDDFMAYWMNEKKRLERDVPPDVKVTPLPEYGGRVKIRSCPNGAPGSFLTRPKCFSVQRPVPSFPIRLVVARF